MSIELGHFALVLAFALALVQMAVPIIGAQIKNDTLMRVGEAAALTNFMLVALSFMALTSAYIQSDFSVLNVWENSHSAKPLL